MLAIPAAAFIVSRKLKKLYSLSKEYMVGIVKDEPQAADGRVVVEPIATLILSFGHLIVEGACHRIPGENKRVNRRTKPVPFARV